MAWVRIHDGALSHPKLVDLMDWRNPFCVWVWGLSYCQTHLTDGYIPAAAIPNPQAKKTALVLSGRGLWLTHNDGYKVHDYLDWNDARELVQQKRADAKARMAAARGRRSSDVLQRSSREQHGEVRKNFYVDRGVSTLDPKEVASESTIADRGARFLERYQQLYSELRNGARLKTKPNLDWTRACDLCRLWDDARLEQLARVFLTTDDDWISRTDRGFGVFESRVSWCDDRLSEAEKAAS